MGSVFISYRREDTNEAAHRLFADLRKAMGHEVFLDEGGGLRPGEDFIDRLGEAISQADVVLVLLGRSWLTVRGTDGKQRLLDPADVLRREVAGALKKVARVVPVLVDGAKMPPANALPQDLRPLTRRHAHHLSQTTWARGVEELARRIEALVEEADHEAEELLDAIDQHGLEPGGLAVPEAAGEQFRNMPIIGKWRIDVKSPVAPHPALGPAGHSALIVSLRDDDTFVGELLVYASGIGRLLGPQRRRLTGGWSLGVWSGGGLLLKLDAVIDGVHEYQYRIPVARRTGEGYFATSEDGLAFSLKSLGGRAVQGRGL